MAAVVGAGLLSIKLLIQKVLLIRKMSQMLAYGLQYISADSPGRKFAGIVLLL